jgi:hypothetical protein
MVIIAGKEMINVRIKCCFQENCKGYTFVYGKSQIRTPGCISALNIHHNVLCTLKELL